MTTERPRINRRPASTPARAREVWGAIEKKVQDSQSRFDVMDEDWDLYTLKQWQPDEEEPISLEDSYTTNSPRVLANKIIAFVANTVPIIVCPNDDAANPNEEANDSTEQLAIGMLANSDRRLRRKGGDPSIQNQLAFFATVRGRYVAARAMLRKRPNGETFEDILPLDPRQLVIWRGEEELKAAAYRMFRTRSEILEEFPRFKFANTGPKEDGATEDVWEYITREVNPDFDIDSDNPFEKHPFIYLAGTLVNSQWIKKLHNVFTLGFPVVLAPVDSQPLLAPNEGDDSPQDHHGESIFADNRDIWDKQNRITSYLFDLVGKASNPRKKIFSPDGTKELEDGASDKGAEIPLMTGQEDVENFQEADLARATVELNRITGIDEVGGGLPPQAFGLLDKPLSSVALRQLGNNLEHKVLPRMNGVRLVLEGCFEIMIGQYETGAFEPITVSGRRFDSHRFANRIIEPEQIEGHDPVEVIMALALPEDETTRWTIAQMAMTPTVTGEPLASVEWTRENILRMQSHRTIRRQNLEDLAQQSTPLTQTLQLLRAAVEEEDEETASILFDRVQILALQHQVEGSMAMAQLQQLAAGIIPNTPAAGQSGQNGSAPSGGGTQQALNPANGAIPFAQAAGVGNEASEDAGANTTATRNRDTGILNARGQPIFA